MPSTPFGSTIRSSVGPVLRSEYMQGNGLVSPIVTQNVLGRLLGVTASGELQSNVALKVPRLQVGSGALRELAINGLHLGMMSTNCAHLTKICDVDEEMIEWDPSIKFFGFDNNSVTANKTSVLIARYADAQGTQYGLIRTTYNLDFQLGDNTQLFDNYLLSRTMKIYEYEEVVVLGFTFASSNINIFIPDNVLIDDDDTKPRYFPVREIWSAEIIASVNGGSAHQLTLRELANADSVDYTPATLYAPFITKISMKRRLSQNYSAFCGTCARSIYMPSLARIVGAGPAMLSPIFSSLNGEHTFISRLSLPALREIRYAIFASNCTKLTNLSLPALEELHETIFMKGDILISELEFPSLKIIQGCDFFLANCYNLEKLHFCNYFWWRPHIYINSSLLADGNFNGYMALVRGTLQLLAIDGVYSALQRYNKTNAMSYFLHADTKLMNATYSSSGDTEEEAFNAPYDKKNVHVEYGTGLFFDLYKYSSGNDFSSNTGDKYGNTKETLAQWCRRTGNAVPDEFGTATEISFGGNKYYIDPTYGMMCDGNTTDSFVVPVDPRTALFNNTSNGMTTGRNTSVHLYSEETPANRFVENNESYGGGTQSTERRDWLKKCLGGNQYYDYTGSQ